MAMAETITGPFLEMGSGDNTMDEKTLIKEQGEQHRILGTQTRLAKKELEQVAGTGGKLPSLHPISRLRISSLPRDQKPSAKQRDMLSSLTFKLHLCRRSLRHCATISILSFGSQLFNHLCLYINSSSLRKHQLVSQAHFANPSLTAHLVFALDLVP